MSSLISRDMKRFNYLLGGMDAAYHEISLKLGMSDSAMIILYTICDIGDCCLLTEICRLSGLSKQTVNSSLRKLEAQGTLYLEKAGPKGKKVCLTEAGKTLAEQTALRLLRTEDAILASWPRQDVEKYLDLTERFLNALRKEAEKL